MLYCFCQAYLHTIKMLITWRRIFGYYNYTGFSKLRVSCIRNIGNTCLKHNNYCNYFKWIYANKTDWNQLVTIVDKWLYNLLLQTKISQPEKRWISWTSAEAGNSQNLHLSYDYCQCCGFFPFIQSYYPMQLTFLPLLKMEKSNSIQFICVQYTLFNFHIQQPDNERYWLVSSILLPWQPILSLILAGNCHSR